MAFGLIIFLFVLLFPGVAHADPVTIAIGSALYSIGVPMATAIAIGSAVTSFLGSVVLAGLSAVIGGAGKKGGTTAIDQSITQSFREAVSERKIVYGERRVSGTIVFIEQTVDNKYFHYVIPVACHEIEAFEEVIVNDISIPLDAIDGSGNVTEGRYAGKMRIKFHLGTSTQSADADLVSEVTDWTSAHQGKSIAYAYLRLEKDRDVYPSSVPNASFYIRGAKVLDTRDSTEKYHANIGLIAHDYMTDTRFGIRSTGVNEDRTTTTANICDEIVTTANLNINFTAVDTATDIITLSGDIIEFQRGDRVTVSSGTIGGISGNVYVIPYQRKDTVRIKLASTLEDAMAGTAISLTSGTTGTITKNGEPRYHGGGVLTWGEEPGKNLQDILSGMGGFQVDTGGNRYIYPSAYNTPTISFDESDLVGDIVIQTEISKTEAFNAVGGVYSSPINNETPTDYPPVSNSTYETEDGESIKADLPLVFTQRAHTAQRLAKISMERSRQEIVFTANFNLQALKVQCGDNFNFSFGLAGWTNKVFEVITWRLAVVIEEGVPVPVVSMTCQENASAVYDWNSGEETQVDPAPNSNFPNPFTVAPITGLGATPEEVGTASGDPTYKFNLSWNTPNDFFITSGGRIELGYKKSSQTDYRPSFFVDGEQTTAEILQVQPGINYDVRIRAHNEIGARSSWAYLLGFTVSSPSGATIRIDYGLITASVVDTIDRGLITVDPGDDVIDYGGL